MVIDACAELTRRIVANGGDTNLLEQNGNSLKDYVKSKASSSSDVLSSKSVKSESQLSEKPPKSSASILVVIG